MTHYLVVPQWQGSPSSRAMQLIDGAEAVAGDLPRSATTVLPVPVEAGEALGTGIRRLSSLTRIRAEILSELATHDEPVLTVGGDCGVALAAVEHAASRVGSLAVVWLDAHADFHTPESTPSGAFSGMVLRAIVGDGEPALALAPGTIPPARVIVAGTRSSDAAEVEALAEQGIRVLSVGDLRSADALGDAVRATGADSAYVHVDIDVLDPAALAGNAHPEPFGLSVAELTTALASVRTAAPIVGASLAGYSPASAEAATDDLGAILRIVGALA